ncbi:MAG: sigma-70 family RNA polymerase sigma factor [Alphaproteobacteria bacterium]|nr:sigma-70 family RNA polymerase sigma factor [Alphaproteobacteria bacterium]
MVDDEALMRRVAEGDRAAFARLMDRHLSRALALAERVAGNRGDAEELVQEAMLRVWTEATRFRPELGSFRAWFNRILVNLCLDRRRRPTGLSLEAAGDPADPAPDALAQTLEARANAALRAAVAELPERQRVALALCYWEGQSNQQAAEALATSVSAVETLLVRARRLLKAKLLPPDGSEDRNP